MKNKFQTIEERSTELIEKLSMMAGASLAKADPERFKVVMGLIGDCLRGLGRDCIKLAEAYDDEETGAARRSRDNGKGLSELSHACQAIGAKEVGEKIRALIGDPAKVDPAEAPG